MQRALAQGSPVISWQAGRKATVKIDSDLISPRLLTIILGAVETTESTGNMTQMETGKIDSATATYSLQSASAVGTLSVFLTEADGKTVKSELTVAGGASPTASEYKITGQSIAFDASNKGQNVLCIYAKAGVNITKLAIKASQYASPYKLIALGQVRLESGIDKLVEITIPTLVAQSNMDLSFDSANPSKFSFTFDVNKDPVTDELIIQRFL